jgi:hypothetical protein
MNNLLISIPNWLEKKGAPPPPSAWEDRQRFTDSKLKSTNNFTIIIQPWLKYS